MKTDMREKIKELQLSIRKISEKASKQEDCIRFDIGQPNFDTPQHVKKYVKEQAIEQKQPYTNVKGIKKLREEIIKEEKQKNGLKDDQITYKNVMVTVGGMGAIYNIFTARLEETDTVILNDPCWGPYKMISTVNDNQFKQVEYWNDEGRLSKEAKKKIKNAEIAVVNTPGNPTGKVLSKEQAKEIGTFADENNTFLISDEVYHRLTYDKEHYSPAAYTDDAAIIGSVSKNHAMTGWRIGWIIDKEENIANYGKVARASTACPPKISQQAAYKALKDDEHVKKMREEYKERRDLLVEKMNDLEWDFEKPEGAIYAFPNVGEDSWDYCMEMIGKGVSMVPGEPMGPKSDQNVRICFGSTTKEEITKAFEKIEERAK